jgi:hypothetical protein
MAKHDDGKMFSSASVLSVWPTKNPHRNIKCAVRGSESRGGIN